MHGTATDPLVYPHPVTPKPGELTEVAPGILWLRLALPFQLNHVNIYLIEHEGGWAVVDTGIGTDQTKATWDAVFVGSAEGREDHAADRHAFASRPHRPRRLARRAIQVSADDDADRIFPRPVPSDPPHRDPGAGPGRVLPHPRHRRGRHQRPARPRLELSDAHHRAAAEILPHQGRRHAHHRHAHASRCSPAAAMRSSR